MQVDWGVGSPIDGLYYYRARYYSPELGRFLQTDPIGYEDQMNLYAYVGNDPLNMVDPDGRCGRPPNVLKACSEFTQGALEGATGSYTAYRTSQQAMNGDPRAQYIFLAIGFAADVAMRNFGATKDMVMSSAKQNPARVTGRVAGGFGVSFFGTKGYKALWNKAGGSSSQVGRVMAGVSIGATSFSAGQIGEIINTVGGFYDSAIDKGFDPTSLSSLGLKDVALVAAAGGDIDINSEAGQITTKVKTSSSRIARTIVLGTLEELEKKQDD